MVINRSPALTRELFQIIGEHHPQAVSLDGLEGIIAGVCTSNSEEGQLVYFKNDILELLVNRDKMSWDEAEEFYEYNILGTTTGMHSNKRPIIIDWEFINYDSTDPDNLEQLLLPF